MKYDKAKIMKQAWSMFNNETWLCDLDHVESNGDFRIATFAECLKEAWGKAKELTARPAKQEADAPRTEQVKAWDWACRKLGVDFNDVTAVEKVRFVDDMQKEMWSSNIWTQAIKAVKLHMEIAAYRD